jgi:phosphate transport system substrate-binding protein
MILAVICIVVILSSVVGVLYLAQPAQTVSLSGSGATFPAPILSAMITNYQTIKSNVAITYDAVGSTNGILSLENKTRDFACSDAPLGAPDRAKAPNVLHIPETIGAVAVAYNLPNVPTGLHLTGKVLADIFSGKITLWNDAAIQQLNPAIMLPAQSITVVHRSEGSGTTFIFTSYLSEASPDWNASIGKGKTVIWPVGLEANGNPGLAGVVQANVYAIGYVELAYVIQNNMTIASIQNPKGNWIIPSLKSTRIAAESGASSGLPAADDDWSKVSLLDAQDPQAYPIVSFSYILVYKELNVVSGMTADRALALVNFLWWVIHDGQNIAPQLEYVQLPSNVVQVNEAALHSVTFNGQLLLSK